MNGKKSEENNPLIALNVLYAIKRRKNVPRLC